jgi:hypothetical protein
MSSSSVKIVTSAAGFLAFAVDAAVIPAAPEPITIILLDIYLTYTVIESILITILVAEHGARGERFFDKTLYPAVWMTRAVFRR